MRNRNVQRLHARNISSAEVSPLPWRYFIVMVVCGCVLAAGFFFAARQHFTSMEYGINNSKLRKQLEDLESENRRLLLSKEISLSPGEIKKAARNLGFREAGVENVVIAAAVTDPRSKMSAAKTVEKHSAIEIKPDGVTKTAFQKPIKEAPVNSASNIDRVAKQATKSSSSSDSRERVVLTIAKLR